MTPTTSSVSTRITASQHPSRPRRRFPRRNRRGVVGILVSVVIAVAIIIGIFAAFNNVNATTQATQTAVFIRQLVPQATRFYRGDYTGFNATTAIRSGWVPADWQSSDTAIEDPRGNDVTIAAAGTGDANFDLEFDSGVTTETCEAVLGALRSEPRFVRATIDKKNKTAGALDTPAEIVTECAAAEDDDFVLRFK